MPTWILEPRDPLIARDGRPFGPNPGARAVSLPFPYPSTTTGGVRTQAGMDDQGTFVADSVRLAVIKKIVVRGPLLVELDRDSDQISRYLVPAPADALLLEPDKGQTATRRQWLVPLADPAGVKAESGSNLPPDLHLVGPSVYYPGKPSAEIPRYWYWKHFCDWLGKPGDGLVTPADLGHNGPQGETRMHVSIAQTTQTADEGALFRTGGLEFRRKQNERNPTLTDLCRLALVVETAQPFAHFAGGLAPLGGERRLMAWRESTQDLSSDLKCPIEIRKQIKEQRHCRLVLLTPALFTTGYRPAWVAAGRRAGVQSHLRAAIVLRPQVVSGWDFEHSRPKPTRRLAPAGSVYYLALPQDHEADDTAIDAWIDSIWLCGVCDSDTDNADGFGLAVLGTWDGNYCEQQLREEAPHAPT